MADDGVVALTLDLPKRVGAGERAWATLTVRNIGKRVVWWQAGGGLPPATAALRTADDPLGMERWSGVPSELDRSIPRAGAVMEFRGEKEVGLLSVFRTLPSQMKALHPGDAHALRVAADVRLPPGAAATLQARAVAIFYNDASDYGGAGSVGPRPDVIAQGTVHVTGIPDDDAQPAIEAFAADRRLAAFIADTRVEHVENSWHTSLVWWDAAWELTVTPYYSDNPRGQSRYRLRYQRGHIIDARRIWWDQVPADDPDGTRFPGAPPDDVE